MPEMITTDVLPSTGTFKMMSGTLKAATGDDGRKRVSGVASSTTRDLHGDTMSESAIMSMERQANDNLTIFMNHKYDVPEDVFGSVESATAVQRGMDGDGNPNWDLLMTIVVNDDNPRAEKSFQHIQKGTKLGLSIGAMIPEGGAVREKDTGALIINDLLLLETSVVSIPANPRSWIQNAATAMRKALQEQPSEEPASDPTILSSGSTVIEAAEDICEGCGGSKKKPMKDCESDFHAVEEAAPTTDVEAGTTPADQSHPEEAPASDPAEDDATLPEKAAEPEKDDESVAVAMAHVQSVDKVIEAITAKLADMTDKLDSEKRAREDAERQRDEATAAATQLVEEVRSIMERVGKTPVGRKTQFLDAQKDFEHLSGIYSEPFRKMLSNGERK